MTTILKLGGSLLTDKSKEAEVDIAVLEAVSEAIGTTDPGDLVIVHGGGSFGHRAADRHGITTEDGTRDPTAIREVMDAMDRLNAHVLEALVEAEVPAVGLPPRGMASKSADGALELASGAVHTLLAEDLVPVLYGDLVAHEGTGMTVLSGDTLAVEIADTCERARIGFCAGVPGVLDAEGAVIPRVRAFEDVADELGAPAGTDVSGGMAAKVRALLEASHHGAIFGLDGLAGFLAGEMPGTRIG